MTAAPSPAGRSTHTVGWRTRIQGLLDFLSSPGRFSGGVWIYLGVLFALRIALFPGASEDDAETLLLSQSLEGVYKTGQPPLYIWLAYGLTQVFGATLPVVFALKFVCLSAVYVLVYRLARLFTNEGVWAAVAGLSVLGIYYLSWDAVLNYSQTVMLAALSVAFIHALVRIGVQSQPGWGAYVWLGILTGAGIMTKYNFVILLAAVLIAAFADHDLRSKFIKRGFLSVLIAAVITLPHGMWLMINTTPSGALAAAVPEIGDTFMTRVHGLVDMVEAIVSVLSPLIVLLVIFFPRMALRLGKASDEKKRWLRFVDRAFVFLVVLMTAMILISGISEVRNHWFIVLVAFPAYAVLRLSVAYPICGVLTKRTAGFVTVLLALGAAVGIGVTARAMTLPSSCEKCKMVVPYQQLAAGLNEAGFEAGTIYVHDYPTQVGGNLRRFFPDSRIVSYKFPTYTPPSRENDGQCLAVWLLGASGQSPEPVAMIGRLQNQFSITPLPDDAMRTVDVILSGRAEPLRYGYILIDDAGRQGSCH